VAEPRLAISVGVHHRLASFARANMRIPGTVSRFQSSYGEQVERI
jgi:hypothetical protein